MFSCKNKVPKLALSFWTLSGETMEVIVTRNMPMGLSGFHRIEDFSPKFYPIPSPLHFPQKLNFSLSGKKLQQGRIFSVALPSPFHFPQKLNFSLSGKKPQQGRIFSVRAAIDSGRFSEKQLEFQPAFDEYLKALESVRTGIDQKPMEGETVGGELGMESKQKGLRGSNQRGLREINQKDSRKLGLRERGDKRKKDGRSKLESTDSSFETILGEFEKTSGRRENEGFNGKEGKIWKSSFGKSDASVGSNKNLRGKGEGKIWKSSFSQSDAVKSVGNKKYLRGKGEGKIWKSSFSQSDAVKGVGSDDLRGEGERRIWKSSSGQSGAVKSVASNKDFREGCDQRRSSTGMQKKELSKNALQVTTKGNNIQLHHGMKKFERRPLEFGSVRKEVSRRDIYPKMGDTDTVAGSNFEKLIHRNKNEKQMDEFQGKMGMDRSYRNESNPRPNGSIYVREKVGPSSTRTHARMGSNQTYTEDTGDKVSLRSMKLDRGSKIQKESVDEGVFNMERAAFKFFEVFTDVRGEPRVSRVDMEKRIENLAKWLNGTDIDLPEWIFSKMMHSAKIRFSDHSILRIIQILGKLGNWRRVLQVIEWLQSRERFKSYRSRFIYTAALDALGKAKRPVEALNVFYAMQNEFSSYPDLAAYHCIAVTLGQAGHTKELFDVIDCMRSPPQKNFKAGVLEKWDPRLEPDIVVYNAVLNACARRKQWEGAFWVLQQLKERGLHPSSTTYGLVMEVMLACEKYNLVHEFFRKVEKFSIPNSLNYRVLLNAFWKEGKTDEAVAAVQDMERRGVVGSASLYYDLARCLCSAGRCEEALMQIDKICKVANKPLVVTYTGLIQACLNVGSIQNGSYIFQQMHKFCSPNLVTCNIMLRAYLEHKMFEDAKELFQKMLDDSCGISSKDDHKSVVPDNYTFNTMLSAYAEEQKWDDFKYVYREMIHRGFNFNAKRHLQMVLEACRAGKGELLDITWKHLTRAGRVPPPPIVKERFCMKLEEEDYDAAIFCITSHPTIELPTAYSEKGWLDLFKAKRNRFQKDTLVRLTQELNNLIVGSEQPHPIVKNVITSCRQFIRTLMSPLEVNPKSQNMSEEVVIESQ